MSDAIELIKTMHVENQRLRTLNAELLTANAMHADNKRLREVNTELVGILQRLIEASDRQVSALSIIEEARAAIAKAKGEA